MNNPTEINAIGKEAGLYIVSTPIGNMSDMTYRAVSTLKAADLVLCEDTRETKKLLSHYNITAKTESYNDHNGEEKRPEIIEMLKNGMMLAMVSDAGTPLVSDPGYKLVKYAIEAGIRVYPIPGASSLLAAMVMSGMPSDAFSFCGFADTKKFDTFSEWDSTLVFFESARRLTDMLTDMKKTFSNRSVSVCREITKMFEETKHGTYDELIKYYTDHPPKGEIVILLSPPEKIQKSADTVREELAELLKTMKVKEAAEVIGEKYGINKKKVYELGISLKNN